jgi:hypothetical protein
VFTKHNYHQDTLSMLIYLVAFFLVIFCKHHDSNKLKFAEKFPQTQVGRFFNKAKTYLKEKRNSWLNKKHKEQPTVANTANIRESDYIEHLYQNEFPSFRKAELRPKFPDESTEPDYVEIDETVEELPRGKDKPDFEKNPRNAELVELGNRRLVKKNITKFGKTDGPVKFSMSEISKDKVKPKGEVQTKYLQRAP